MRPDRFLVVSRALFAVGLAAVVVVLAVFAVTGSAPLWASVLVLLMPVGLGLALTVVVRSIRQQSRAVAAASETSDGWQRGATG